MTSRHVDRAVAALASRQHQLFALGQAYELGASRSLVDRRRRAGLWPLEAPGVYGIAGATPTWERRLMLAHLDLGSYSVISHRAAAALHKLPGARKGAPELTVPRGASRSPRWRSHRGDVPPHDTTRVNVIPVTTVTRTVLDLAAIIGPPALQRLVEDLLVEKRLQLEPFTCRAIDNRRPGRRGSAALVAIVESLGPGKVPPASELEARLFAILDAAGLPPPVRQFPLPSITGAGRVDAAYPACRLLLEVDGRRWHTRAEDFDRDRRRDIEASLLGWRVLRFTWSDVVERPQWVCQVVAAHLRMAA